MTSTVYLTNVTGNIQSDFDFKCVSNGSIYAIGLNAMTNATTSVGTNIFTAKIVGLPNRTKTYCFLNFNSATIIILMIKPDNNVYCRTFINSLGSGNALEFGGVLIPL